MKAPKGAGIKMYEALQKNYPGFDHDKEMNAMALVQLAHVIGVVAAYFLHNQGERGLDKAINMIVTTVRKQAFEGDAIIRDKKALLRKDIQ